MGAQRTVSSLASRIVRVTLLLGLATVIAASAAALVGILRLNQSRTESRDRMFIQVIEDRIEARFSRTSDVVDRVNLAMHDPSRTRALDHVDGIATQAVPEVCARIIIASEDGRVIASYPQTSTSDSIQSWPVFQRALAGGPAFFEETGTAAAQAGAWTVGKGTAPDGTKYVVLAQVDMGFMSGVFGKEPPRDTALLVLRGSEPVVGASSGPAVRVDEARWEEPSDGALGSVKMPAANGEPMSGYYDDIEALGALEWRVIVVEPSISVAGETARAVVPSLLVLLAGGVIATAFAWGIATRLVSPLRSLEAAAYHAATGAYVRPLRTERDDEVGRLAEAFNAVTLRLNALHDLSQLLASASRLDQVLDGIMSAMGHIVGPGAVAVYLLDEEGAYLMPARVRGVDDRGDVLPVKATGGGWLARALARTEPVEYQGLSANLQYEIPGMASGGTVTALAAPLVGGHEVLGVVVVTQVGERTYSDAELEMVRTFSAQAAVAVHNSHLFAVEIESRRVSEGLREIVEALVAPDRLHSALPEVGERAKELLGADTVVVGIADRAALGLPVASDSRLESAVVELATVEFGLSEVPQPVTIHAGADRLADDLLERIGGEVLLLAPIVVTSGQAAVLLASGARFSARQVSLAMTVAKELGLALDNAYFYERAVSRAANLETIFRISQAIGSSLEINVVLNRVLDVVQKILSGHAVSLMRYDRTRRLIVTDMARGTISEDMLHYEVRPGEDILGGVFVRGEPVVLHDLQDGVIGIGGLAAAQGLHSMLSVPLLARGRSIGVLSVFATPPNAFTEEDMNVLQTFATQAALAIDTARLYSREHLVSKTLTESILPERLPQIAGIDASSRYVPAGADAEIGGDFYDVFSGPDGSAFVVIGDVCGKGVTAATKTSMIRYSVQAFVAAGMSPGRVLHEVNRMTAEAGDRSDISTLVIVRLDVASGEMTWASGGHPPGFLLRAETREIERFEPTGPLLGAISDVDYDELFAVLHRGDTLLLYTDGVTEARRGNIFFGEDRVRRSLSSAGTAQDVTERLLDDVRRYSEGDLRDDVAILAVRLEPANDSPQGENES